jgi:hypothetical protein
MSFCPLGNGKGVTKFQIVFPVIDFHNNKENYFTPGRKDENSKTLSSLRLREPFASLRGLKSCIKIKCTSVRRLPDRKGRQRTMIVAIQPTAK